MNQYLVRFSPAAIERRFFVTADSPERAAELVWEDEEERDGESVKLVNEKDWGGGEVVSVEELSPEDALTLTENPL